MKGIPLMDLLALLEDEVYVLEQNISKLQEEDKEFQKEVKELQEHLLWLFNNTNLDFRLNDVPPVYFSNAFIRGNCHLPEILYWVSLARKRNIKKEFPELSALRKGWIAVEQALPENEVDVLVLVEEDGKKEHKIASLVNYSGEETEMVRWYQAGELLKGDVSFWQPLPVIE